MHGADEGAAIRGTDTLHPAQVDLAAASSLTGVGQGQDTLQRSDRELRPDTAQVGTEVNGSGLWPELMDDSDPR